MNTLQQSFRGSALALAGLSLSACLTLGSNYSRPEMKLPGKYDGTTTGTPAPISDTWWKAFGDPALDRLMDEAVAANQDLAAAAARVEESRALYGETQAERYPEVYLGFSGTRSKLSQQTSQLPPTADLTTTRVRATANLAYEFDFWGRYANASKAARAELVASEAGRRSVLVALQSDVVDAYIDLLAFDHQLAVTRRTSDSRVDSVKLQQVRYDAGSISELDLAQAQAELATTEAAAPALQILIRQTEDRLAVLLGRIGGEIARAPETQLTLPEVPAGLPSDLLTRRADVAAAEQHLVAQHALIAVARAGYFPSISLTAFGGSESKDLAGLFSTPTNIWQAAASLLQPIFQAGKVTRQVEAARAREKQALAGYAKTVQTAFAEVEDSLAARALGTVRREALARQVEALDRARRLASLRYEAGDSSYLEVLDAERSLFQAELQLSGARRDELQAAVTLFKSLGGGWPASAATAPAPQQ
ncbi:MAG: efflux transporter outer membrane subunit [Acidobacteriota bacterium]